MGTFGWTDFIVLAVAIRQRLVGNDFSVGALLAMLRNEVSSDWAIRRGNKERFEFAVLTRPIGGSGSGRQAAGADITVPASSLLVPLPVLRARPG